MLTEFFIIIYLPCFLKLIIAGCTVLDTYDLHNWEKRHQWSDKYCCDISNSNNCKFELENTVPYIAEVEVIENKSFFDSAKTQISPEYTYTKQWGMKIDIEMKPGTCKYIDISTTRTERLAKGECCYWAIFWYCSYQETRWHYTQNSALYFLMEAQCKNGEIEKETLVEIERGVLFPKFIEQGTQRIVWANK
ncbi:hypothetical protein BB559_000895 [Furculomyces boomerangus]|uniref:Uncharacterized protein n=2 Tax=Harpellales TaxID=61421 RepID=A0A2T9Z3P4_9FUNG|nr:hypothetical protein BB559_000895 [Furculomyces boomerangus]PWA02083.1 hypothetical protein BB558_001789 [Smittium angustum]